MVFIILRYYSNFKTHIVDDFWWCQERCKIGLLQSIAYNNIAKKTGLCIGCYDEQLSYTPNIGQKTKQSLERSIKIFIL